MARKLDLLLAGKIKADKEDDNKTTTTRKKQQTTTSSKTTTSTGSKAPRTPEKPEIKYQSATRKLDLLLEGKIKPSNRIEYPKNYVSTEYDDMLTEKNSNGFFGKFESNYELAEVQEKSNLAWNEYIKNPTTQNKRYAEALDNIIAKYSENNASALDDDGWISKSAASYLPQLKGQLWEGGQNALAAGAVGAGVGAGVGAAVGGVGAVPGAITGGTWGLRTGYVAGSAKYGFDTMRGAAYKGLLAEGYSEEVAREAAEDEAYINALIEGVGAGVDIFALGFGTLLKNAGKVGLKKLAGEAVEGVAKQTLGKTLLKGGAGYGLNVGFEGLEEAAQEVVGIANKDRLESGQSGLGNLVSESWKKAGNLTEEEKAQVKASATEGMKVAAMFGLPASVATNTMNYKMNNAMYDQNTQTGRELLEMGATVDDIISTGLESDQKSQSYKFAKELYDKQARGETITDAELGGLYRANTRAINAESVKNPTGTTYTTRYEDALSKVGDNGAKAISQYYKSEQDFDEFYNAFSRYYEAGVSNIPRERVTAITSEFARYLEPEVREVAYSAGLNDAKVSLHKEIEESQYATVYGKEAGFIKNNVSKGVDQTTIDTINEVAKAVGVKVTMAEKVYGGLANGSYKDGVVTIAKDSKNPYFVVAKHEITHHIQKVSPKEYRKYRDYAVALEAIGSDTSTTTLIERYKAMAAENNVTLTTEEAMDEIAADFTEKIIKNEDTLKKFVNEADKGAVKKFFEAVRDFINKVKKAFKGNKAKMDEAAQEAYGATISELERAEQLWKDAFKAAKQNAQNGAKNTQETGIQEISYSLKNIEGEKGSYGIGVLLDTDLFNGVKPRDWGKKLSDFVYNNLAGTELVAYDEDSNAEIINIAKKNERVQKDGAKNSHKVVEKLARTNGDNIKTLITVHLPEAVEQSTLVEQNLKNSHGWLDENGWEFRKVYVEDVRGKIYQAIMNIAKARDGRKILYSINQVQHIDNKKSTVAGDVSSTHKGRDSHRTHNASTDSTSQNQSNVKTQFSLKGDTAKWTSARIDRLYEDYASSAPNYSQAYATYISPEDFLSLTTLHLDRIEAESRELNLEELANNKQPIYLSYDPELPNEVYGHEGRHRMVAFRNAGIKKVPIVVRFYGEQGKSNRQPIAELPLIGEEWGDQRAKGKVTLTDLVPISQAYRKEVEKKFGATADDTVKFSLKKDSQGNTLSQQQADYFQNSKVRDKDGNLMMVYHGSKDYGFTVFDPSKSDDKRSLFFTNDYDTAQSYVNDDSKMYRAYLNIENPLVVEGRGHKWNQLYLGENDNEIMAKVERYIDIGMQYDNEVNVGLIRESLGALVDATEYMIEDSNDIFNEHEIAELRQLAAELDKIYDEWDEDAHLDEDGEPTSMDTYVYGNTQKKYTTRQIAKIAKDRGHDGVIINDVYDNGKYSRDRGIIGFGNVYIAFNSDQVKLTSNQNPTKDNDIRFSLKKGLETDSDLHRAGVSYDTKSESASPVLYSLKTWNKSDYVLAKEEAAKKLAKVLGITEKKALSYIDSVNGIAKMIADDRVRLDYEGSPERSSFVNNSEYGGSIDFSTICKKRRLFTGTFEAIQEALPNTALTADEFLEIRDMMDKKGHEVSCGLCYVEGSRANMGQYTKQFIERYKETNPKYVPNMAEMNTASGQEKLRKTHPEVYEAYEYFMNHYGRLKDGDKALFASQQKPKMYQMATEYKGEVLSKFGSSRSNVAKKNENGGLRIQSFSDFEIIHLLDMMQVIMDMSATGLAGQAYTKVPDFAWAMGDTGLKINLSLIAKGIDKKGKLIMDEKEGMSEASAMALRNRYSENVGTIIVVFTDRQLKAAMADNRIDFIIPFHRSQWKTDQYKNMGLPENTKDFTAWQNEAYITPVYNKSGKKQRPENYMPNSYWDFTKTGKENAEKYLQMCAEDNRRPKFHYLLVDNQDGSYSLQKDGSTDGYWKLLIDFKMYDNDGKGAPQRPVVPDFNMTEARRMLNDYMGGHTKFPVADDVVEEFVSKYKKEHPQSAYSLKGQSDLLKENAKLRQYNEYLKNQLKVTKVVKQDKKAMEKLAKDILKDHNSDMTQEELVTQLEEVYDYIANEETPVWEELKPMARAVAKNVLEEATMINDELYQSYSGLRKHLKKVRMTLSEQDRSDLHDGYNEFRKANFGRLNLVNDGTPIGRVYQDLAEMYPEFFDAEQYTHPAEQLEHIADVLDSLRPVEENPYSYDMDAATEWLADSIIDKFYEVPQAKKTFADKAEAKLTKQKIKGAEKVNRVREQKNQQIERIRQQANERIAAAVKKEKEAKWKKVEQVKEHQREKEARMSDRRKKSVLVNKIKKHTAKISKMLLNPTEQSHVPEALRKPVSEFLAMLDLTTDRLGEKSLNRLYQLQKEYQKIADGKTDYYMEVDPDLLDNLTQVIESVTADTRIVDMEISDLDALYRATMAVERSIYSYNRMLSDHMKATISEYGEQAMKELDTGKGYTESVFSPKQWMADMLNMDMLAPADYFEQLGDTMLSLWNDGIRRGFDKKIELVKESQDYIKKLAKDNGIKAKDVTGNTARAKKFKLTNGTIELTPSQVMSLYLLNRQEDALEHIYTGGIKTAPTVAIKEGKKRIPKVVKSFDTLKVTPEDVDKIISSLSDNQKAFAEGISQFFTDYTAEWGNEVSVKLYGYKKFTVKKYFPIVSDRNYLNEVFGETNDMTLKNMGSTKSRIKGANNPIIIEDVFDVFTRQADQMSSYNAFVIPLTDMQRVYNYKTFDGSVKQAVGKKFGSRANKYFSQLMTDINGGARFSGGWQLVNSAISKYKQARLGANLRVVLQQPTAYLRAGAMISPKYLAAATPKFVKFDTIKKYAPIAQWKDWGYFSMDTGKSMKNLILDKKEISDYSMKLAKVADEFTWGRIWAAVELETKAEHKDLQVGSEEFYKAVGRRFSEVVDRTQVVDSTLHRPQIMRNPDTHIKVMVSFMSEPMKSYNMLRTSARNVLEGRVTKTDLFNTSMAFLSAIVVNHVITGFVDALRGDEDDEFMLDKIADWFDGEDEESEEEEETLTFKQRWMKHFADNLANEPLGYFPYVKDIASMFQGYTIKRLDTAGIGDLVNAGKRAMSDSYTWQYKVADVTAKIADLFGIPASSLKREVVTFVKLAFNAQDDPMLDYNVSKSLYNVKTNKAKYMDILYKALKSGDMDMYNELVKNLIDEGLTGKEIENAMKSRAKKDKEMGTDISSFDSSLAGIGIKYADPEEDEEEDSFKVEDLSGSAYVEYTDIKADLLDDIIADFKDRGFGTLDEETANNLIGAAYSYANSVALQEASDGQYEDDTKWIGLAQTSEKDLGISIAEYIMLKEEYGSGALASESLYEAYQDGMDVARVLEVKEGTKDIKADKDSSGKTISGSKKKKVSNYLNSVEGLTEEEYYYFMREVFNYKI